MENKQIKNQEGILIIKSYWANKEQEKESETAIKEYLKHNKITSFNICDKEIKNFKITFNDKERIYINYSLKGKNLKYYWCFLSSGIALYKNKIKVLWDSHYLDYKTTILKDEVIKELKRGLSE